MLRKPTNDLSIRPKMSRSTVMVLVVTGAFMFLASCYFAYGEGIRSGHKKFTQDQALIAQLNSSITEIKSELAAAQESSRFSQRQQQIQEEAYKQISKAYANSEQKNSVLGSRLDFYRSIISPEDGQSGPAIQDVKHQVVDGMLSFDVTLVQAIKHKHQVRGNLKVSLYEGDALAAQWPASSTRSVSYQYFQQVSGSFERSALRGNERLKVELEVQGGAELERWFSLSQAVGSEVSSS